MTNIIDPDQTVSSECCHRMSFRRLVSSPTTISNQIAFNALYHMQSELTVSQENTRRCFKSFASYINQCHIPEKQQHQQNHGPTWFMIVFNHLATTGDSFRLCKQPSDQDIHCSPFICWILKVSFFYQKHVSIVEICRWKIIVWCFEQTKFCRLKKQWLQKG